jgi:hypothetical protein
MVVGHALQIDFGVRREVPGQDEEPFDLSGASIQVWLRARDKTGALIAGRSQQLAKVAGTGGFVSDAYACGATELSAVRWSIVVVDTNAPAGKTDRIVFSWTQSILLTTP